MVAVAWAAIGLLAVTVGLFATALFQLRSEVRSGIAELRTELHSEIADLRAEMREGFRTLSGRLDAHVDRHAG